MVRIALIPRRLARSRELLALNDERAAAILNAILSLDRGNPEANWLMSRYHQDKNHYIMALMFLHDMLRFNRFSADIREQDVRESLVRVYLLLGNVDKAIEQFNTMSRKWALPSSLLKTAIRMQIDNGFFAEAKKLIKEAMVLYPLDGEFPYLFGLINMRARDFSGAENRFLEAERKNYVSGELDYHLAKVYFALKNHAKSLERLQKIPEGAFERQAIELMTGQNYYFLGNYMAAGDILESLQKSRLLDSSPASECAYFLASSLEMMGRIDDAVSSWSEVSDTDPHYLEARDKIFFYTRAATDPQLRRFLICPDDIFLMASQALLPHLDYSLKKLLFQDSRNLYFFCSSKRDSHLFNEYLVVVTRTATPITPEMIGHIMGRQKMHNLERLTIVAPCFSEDAMVFASDRNIALSGFDLFAKKGLLQKYLVNETPAHD